MGHSILFVDDEMNILTSLKRLFTTTPYTNFFARSGKEALEIMKNNQVNVVVADLRMPEMDGIELLKQVKSSYPDCIRLVLTAYSDKESVMKVIKEGEVWKYILKPWDNKELLATIEKAFSHFDSKTDQGQGLTPPPANQFTGKKVFFLYPHTVINEDFILDLISEYEVYFLKDHKKALRILKKYNDSIIFINIDVHLKEKEWQEYITNLMNDKSTRNVKVGIVSYNSDQDLIKKYLMEILVPCGFIQLKVGLEQSKKIIQKVLEANEAKRGRAYLRVNCTHEQNIFFNIKMEGNLYNGRIIDISISAMACVFDKTPVLEENEKIPDIQLNLKSAIVRLSGILKAIRKDKGYTLYIILFDPNMSVKNRLTLLKFIHATLQLQLESNYF
ncbi:MAG: response regulator [Spirochaetales bacterium]|nr:response regulator [Spirochaetales bacterium]